MANMSDSPEARTVLRPGGKDVAQHQRTGPDSAKRFTPEAPTVFLDHLAASGNVSWSCAEAGISTVTAYNHRRANAAFAREWEEALRHGSSPTTSSLPGRPTAGPPPSPPPPRPT